MKSRSPGCLFCRIAAAEIAAHLVYENDDVIAFLDHRPLFPGHCLLIPRSHFETLPDLPRTLVMAVFSAAQRLELAVERATGAEGAFVAANNRVSQSVPHFHLHIVPRSKGDGLKGFFWPRHRYESEEKMREMGVAIRAALATR